MQILEVEKLPQPIEKEEQNTELLYIKGDSGWKRIDYSRMDYVTRVIYLGVCKDDGDCFAVYHKGYISLCKGKLGNGKLKIGQ